MALVAAVAAEYLVRQYSMAAMSTMSGRLVCNHGRLIRSA